MSFNIARQRTASIHRIAHSTPSSPIFVQSSSLAPSSSRLTFETIIGQNRSLSTSVSLLRNTPARRPKDPLDFASNAVRHALPSGETLIVRSPPSMASHRYSAMDQGTVSVEELPLLHRRQSFQFERNKKLSAEEISEMQRLRQANPEIHTGLQLAKQFGCSPAFVRIVAPAPKQKKIAHHQQVRAQRATWGQNKVLQKELRKERRNLW